jgi:4-amino-4-deoxy-L-arabinose transferase-like glycosyltransferase
MLTLTNKFYTLFFGIIIILSAFNLFCNLDLQYVKDWDEALYGISAFEMTENGNYIVNTYLNKPDYWNLKPPLGLWLIALSFKTFGISIFSLRFPSAFAALLTIFLAMIFAKTVFNKQVSLLSGLVLATSKPFIDLHSGRTGDLDSPLALFIFVFIILLWLYENKKNILFFYISGLIVSLIFLLKSFTVAFPFIIMSCYLISGKKYRNISLREYAVFLSVFFIPLLPWIFFRYQYDGLTFFRTMISYDLLKSGATTTERHTGGILFYIRILLEHYIPWKAMLFVMPVYGINFDFRRGIRKAPELDELYKEKLLLLAAFMPFLITFAYQSKLQWYINPVYPPLAIIISWYLWDMIKVSSVKNNKRILTLIVFLISIAFLMAEYVTAKTFIVVKASDEYNDFRKQDVLLSLKPETYMKYSVVYDLENSRPSEIFVAKALKRIVLKHIPDIDIFIKEDNKNLLILKNAPEEAEKINQYKLNVMANNKDWIIVNK